MPTPVILASRDLSLLVERSAFLRERGFMTVRVEKLDLIASLARFDGFQVIVLDQTITDAEMERLMDELQSLAPRVHVIRLVNAAVSAEQLARCCEICESDRFQGRIHILDNQLALENSGTILESFVRLLN